MTVDLVFGILALAVGLLSVYLRVFRESRGFWMLDRLREVLGERTGTAIHVLCYTVLPIVVGALMIVFHFLGPEAP